MEVHDEVVYCPVILLRDLLLTTAGQPQVEEPLMQQWFHLVQQRNSVVRLESELLIM